MIDHRLKILDPVLDDMLSSGYVAQSCHRLGTNAKTKFKATTRIAASYTPTLINSGGLARIRC